MQSIYQTDSVTCEPIWMKTEPNNLANVVLGQRCKYSQQLHVCFGQFKRPVFGVVIELLHCVTTDGQVEPAATSDTYKYGVQHHTRGHRKNVLIWNDPI